MIAPAMAASSRSDASESRWLVAEVGVVVVVVGVVVVVVLVVVVAVVVAAAAAGAAGGVVVVVGVLVLLLVLVLVLVLVPVPVPVPVPVLVPVPVPVLVVVVAGGSPPISGFQKASDAGADSSALPSQDARTAHHAESSQRWAGKACQRPRSCRGRQFW